MKQKEIIWCIIITISLILISFLLYSFNIDFKYYVNYNMSEITMDLLGTGISIAITAAIAFYLFRNETNRELEFFEKNKEEEKTKEIDSIKKNYEALIFETIENIAECESFLNKPFESEIMKFFSLKLDIIQSILLNSNFYKYLPSTGYLIAFSSYKRSIEDVNIAAKFSNNIGIFLDKCCNLAYLVQILARIALFYKHMKIEHTEFDNELIKHLAVRHKEINSKVLYNLTENLRLATGRTVEVNTIDNTLKEVFKTLKEESKERKAKKLAIVSQEAII